MRWTEIIGESVDVLADARAFILDMLAPLKAQGASTITVDQILDELKANPDFQGTALDANLVMDALKNVKDITIQPDMEGDGAMSVFIGNSAKSRQVDKTQAEQDKEDIRKAARRSLARQQKD